MPSPWECLLDAIEEAKNVLIDYPALNIASAPGAVRSVRQFRQ
jgi:hypothetical protein